MGFDVNEENFQLPKLEIIKKRFRDLALKKHSDKGGQDEEFVPVLKAYKAIIDFFNSDLNKSVMDKEGEIIRSMFKDFCEVRHFCNLCLIVCFSYQCCPYI